MGPEEGLNILAQMQGKPSQPGEDEIFRQASQALGLAYQRIAPRSAKAAKAIAHALGDVNTAREAMKDAGSAPVAAPPDLGGGGGPIGLPGMAGPGL